MYCSKCGKENDDNSLLCASCGNPLNQENNVQSQPTQPQQQMPLSEQQNQLPPQQPKKKQKRGCLIAILVVVGIFLLFGILLISVDTDDTNINETESISVTETTVETSVEFGELLHINNYSIEDNEELNGVVVKVKITPSYSNTATINQNYYNISDLIKNQGYNQYSEIQYWAVADMTDGSERKVISFTVNNDLIQKIFNNEIPDNQMGDYLEDLWILQSLKE